MPNQALNYRKTDGKASENAISRNRNGELYVLHFFVAFSLKIEFFAHKFTMLFQKFYP
jgi:hypothetical protein